MDIPSRVILPEFGSFRFSRKSVWLPC